MICSGPGTGKSRLLGHFQELTIKATEHDNWLKEKLEAAYVLKINFENGFTSGSFESPSDYLVSRLIHQMSYAEIDWQTFTLSIYKTLPQYSLYEVLEKIAESECKEIKNMAFIILVDGLHHLPHEPKSKTSKLYQVLCILADMCNRRCSSRPWVIACVGATLYQPISEWLGDNTRQAKCYFCPPKIDGKVVLIPQNAIEEFFIEDMGGNGAALECLQDQLPNYRSGVISCDN